MIGVENDTQLKRGSGAFTAFVFLLLLGAAAVAAYYGLQMREEIDALRADAARAESAPVTDQTAATFPAGVIVAFDGDGCPVGWSAYDAASGRAVIGAGGGAGLTMRFPGETGGAEAITLTAENLPAHAHGVTVFRSQEGQLAGNGDSFDRFVGGAGAGAGGKFLSMQTDEAGAGDAVDVMAPFIALQYCRKD